VSFVYLGNDFLSMTMLESNASINGFVFILV
jgi:hypothetical protein